MLSSGITSGGTSGADSATLIANAGHVAYNRLLITNEGSVAGFFSTDGGNVWGRIPAAVAGVPAVVISRGRSSSPVLIKRDGGSDMTGVWAFAEWADGGDL